MTIVSHLPTQEHSLTHLIHPMRSEEYPCHHHLHPILIYLQSGLNESKPLNHRHQRNSFLVSTIKKIPEGALRYSGRDRIGHFLLFLQVSLRSSDGLVVTNPPLPWSP